MNQVLALCYEIQYNLGWGLVLKTSKIPLLLCIFAYAVCCKIHVATYPSMDHTKYNHDHEIPHMCLLFNSVDFAVL